MKSDIISSSQSDLPTRETGLPDDFAQRVLGAAREELRHRQRRNRIGATVLLLGVTIPLALFMHARRDNLTSRQSAVGKRIWQNLPSDDALAYQLGQSTTPPDADDYLLPHAHELTWFAFTYSDASWQYDPGWTDDR